MGIRKCKDCPPDSTRPAPHPGPRCATHHRVAKREAKSASHDARVSRVYGIDRGFYAQLKAAQGGVCAICQRATGKTKQLAVDHDHTKSGAESVRGLLCGVCNRILGHVRDDPAILRRAAAYLTDPPAQAVLLAHDGGDE